MKSHSVHCERKMLYILSLITGFSGNSFDCWYDEGSFIKLNEVDDNSVISFHFKPLSPYVADGDSLMSYIVRMSRLIA